MDAARAREMIRCYGYVGPTNAAIPAKFTHHVRPDLLHGSVSPCFLDPGADLEPEDLQRLDTTLFGYYTGSTEGRHPFFSIIETSDQDSDAIATVAANAGWREHPDWSDSIEYFAAPIPGKEGNGDGYAFTAGDVRADRELLERILQLSRIAFDMPEEMITRLRDATGNSLLPAYGVMGTSLAGEDAACGVVFCAGPMGFFTGGVVGAAHRGRGLWRQILRRRQEVSAGAGVERWFYNTVNDRLRGKGDESTRLRTFFRT